MAGFFAIALVQVYIRQGAVGGAQVDADGIACARAIDIAHSSTSAGARMAASCCSLSFGRRTLDARQPRWLNVPLNGAEPTTLPVRRTLAESKPSFNTMRLPSGSWRTASMVK